MSEQPYIMEEDGKKYRMLQVGETIEEGDEVKLKGVWEMMVTGLIGAEVYPDTEQHGGCMPQGYYRRPIK